MIEIFRVTWIVSLMSVVYCFNNRGGKFYYIATYVFSGFLCRLEQLQRPRNEAWSYKLGGGAKFSSLAEAEMRPSTGLSNFKRKPAFTRASEIKPVPPGGTRVCASFLQQ
jgi:hypothetical protein